MFSRIFLSTFKCNLSARNNIICRFTSIPNHQSFLKMNFGSESISKMTCADDVDYPPVYVLSRIEKLASTIKTLSSDMCHGLVVKNVDLPETSDTLSSASIEELADAEIVVADAEILGLYYKSMPKLKWAHCTWAGIELLFEIMNEKPQFILTRHGEEEFCEQIAEYVMGHVLILEKCFRKIWAAQTEKSWSNMLNCVSNYMPNRRLRELTIGILGVGNMGQAIAKFFKPHEAIVIGLSRKIRKPEEFGLFDKIDSSLTNVLAVSDYIVNTLPSTPETCGSLNGDVFKTCTKMPVFINVGRGSIINEDSLVKALENNWLSHAVLDVFQKEPLPIDSKLWNLNNQVTITPHCAAISLPKHIAKGFLSSLQCYQQRSPLKNVVDWEKRY